MSTTYTETERGVRVRAYEDTVEELRRLDQTCYELSRKALKASEEFHADLGNKLLEHERNVRWEAYSDFHSMVSHYIQMAEFVYGVPQHVIRRDIAGKIYA